MNSPIRCLCLAALIPIGLCLQGASVIQFSPLTYTASEGFPNQATVFVDRSQDLETAVGVDVTTSGGTALPDFDYTEITTNLVFVAGETNHTVIIPILNDEIIEPQEAFRVTLSNPTGGAVLGARVKVVRITDNDQGLQVELPTYSVNEDAGAITMRVLRRDDGDFPISVDYATTALTAVPGEDYVDVKGTLEFPSGTTLRQVVVPIVNDAVPEMSETFRITLSNASGGGALGSPSVATVTITDTDEMVQFQAASLNVPEDAVLVRLAVARGESASGATVQVATANAGAVAGQDYTGLTNTIRFAPGERVRFVDVPLLNDGLPEFSEKLRVMLSDPTGGAVLGPTRRVTVTILDNDPGIGFERGSYSVSERFPALEVHVIRGNDGWLGPFAVNYETVDDTARAGVDYVAASGTLSFEANERVKRIPLVMVPNPEGLRARRFGLRLSNATGSIPLKLSATTITIVDDSQSSTVSVRPPVTAQAAHDDEWIHVSWPGSAMVWRADSITGPWEELGPVTSPILLEGQSPAGFYRLESPRSASLYVPSRYDGQTPLPLVLVLHGYGGTPSPDDVESYFQMRPLAEARGFYLCYPEVTLDREGYGFWNATDACCNFYGSTVDDSGFFRGLIEEVARKYSVDRKRIYITGISNGGFMSHRMACDHADLIAGIASLAGMTFLDPFARRPSEPVHVLQIHGTKDDIVPYAGGPFPVGVLPVVAHFPGARATVQMWAALNGCREPVLDAQATIDLDLDVPGLDTTVLRYTACPPGGAVELWTINGGGHVPTLSPQYATCVIDWLLAHPKP